MTTRRETSRVVKDFLENKDDSEFQVCVWLSARTPNGQGNPLLEIGAIA
ncbi:MAG TPA: hypothetical protein IGS37_07190 [Synechococcales cyanobacterium M55_K2018_004]|nr:hypothetical protein [Synechococcales cyanobacterium M55_K2018_004]